MTDFSSSASPDPVAHLRRDLTVRDDELDRLAGRPLTFRSRWGLFSPKAVDDGTRLLLRHAAPFIERGQDVFDLGCGWGPIGITAACLSRTGQVTMVDRDFLAVDYAGRNAADNGLVNAAARLGDGFEGTPADQRFDHVLSNLPAKVGGEQLQILLHDAHRHLRPGGRITVVAITGLRQFIRRHLEAVFGDYDKLKQAPSYTVATARKM